ncbi:hypothetical protein SH668x_003058 [Planctomicrobium sp. SH668]|uniref:hypothetical protein n=1 Tax=Planctomicrobium sp. SH668 TaxID=3448126 RepID=UPI003F5C7B32
MTGYTVHTGSNDKFRAGWDEIFKAKKKPASSEKKSGEKKPGKETGKKGQKK